MPYASLTGLTRKRLRWWLALFFLALVIPTAMLVYQAYSELKWETFHQYRLQAEELAARINDHFMQLINEEEARPFTDYSFLNIAGDPSANFLQRSPLSAYPVDSTLSGLIGYFQIDAQGVLSTPVLPQAETEPSAYGISRQELLQREGLSQRIQQILSENQLVQLGKASVSGGKKNVTDSQQRHDPKKHRFPVQHTPEGAADMDTIGEYTLDDAAIMLKQEPAEEQLQAQAAFDQLNQTSDQQLKAKQRLTSQLGRVEDLKLDYRYQDQTAMAKSAQRVPKMAPALDKRARKERGTLPEPPSNYAMEESEALDQQAKEVRISTFESEIDPFEASLLDSGHVVLFRKVWRDGKRYIQGALIEQQPFLHDLIKAAFQETGLSSMSDLIVAYQGNVFFAFSGKTTRGYLASAQELSGALLHQARLSAPLGDLELIFSIKHMPTGPGATLIFWIAAILLLVLCGGFYMMYRLGIKQIDLVRQQQDFVSAVSHELKTPLTSIRMYGEILREGWATEEKQKTYYDYIHDKSERLSRLIANVLQLARMTRNEMRIDLQEMAVSSLLETVHSKVSAQIERAGFKLNLNCMGEATQAVIMINADIFTQIIINLVDNAIKFAAKAEKKDIDIDCRLQRDGTLAFSVRDYGPGVPRDQMKQIFKLFYRSENELTRETVGTGIGLALVHQLTLAMQGQVDVLNKVPGAEFKVCFPPR